MSQKRWKVNCSRPVVSVKPPSHLIVWLDGSQFHLQLKPEQVVGADRLQLQEFTESHQLRALQVLQRQLVLKQLGESNDVFCCWLLTCTSYLAHTHRGTSECKSPRMTTALNFTVCSLPLWQTACQALTYLLNERGESLRFVLSLSFGFIPPSHLSDGLLEELGQLQFSCQTLLLFLLLQDRRHTLINNTLHFFIYEHSIYIYTIVNRNEDRKLLVF